MDRPVRKMNRLRDYDYSSGGAYFITICTEKRMPYLCEIIKKRQYPVINVKQGYTQKPVGADIIRPEVKLTDIGKIVDYSINDIKNHYDDIYVDKYCIMPDHLHMIISIMRDFMSSNGGRIISAPTVSTVIGSMKRYSSKQIGFSIWQKSFHDHIIRNKSEFQEIYQYIENNPINWANNKFNQNLWR